MAGTSLHGIPVASAIVYQSLQEMEKNGLVEANWEMILKLVYFP